MSGTETLVVPIVNPLKDPKLASSCISKTYGNVWYRLNWEIERRSLFQQKTSSLLERLAQHKTQIYILKKITTDLLAQAKHVVILFLDIEKAYERTWIGMIIETLINWGICGNILHLSPTF